MSRNTGFVRFRENVVDARQDVRPVEHGFEQFDLCAFDIDLEHPDLFIETLEIADEVYLFHLDGVFFGDMSLEPAMTEFDSEYKAGSLSNRACR